MSRANPFYYAATYGVVYSLLLLAAVGLARVLWLFEPDLVNRALGGAVGTAGAVLLVAFATIRTGQRWARREGRSIGFFEGWLLAALMTVLTLGINVGLLALFVQIDGVSPEEQARLAVILNNQAGLMRLGVVLAATLLAIHRFALWTGARGILRLPAQQRPS